MPTINWKIDLGHILLVVITLGGFFVSWGIYTTKLEAATVQVTELKNDVKQLSKEVMQFHVEHAALLQRVSDMEDNNNKEHSAIIKAERR